MRIARRPTILSAALTAALVASGAMGGAQAGAFSFNSEAESPVLTGSALGTQVLKIGATEEVSCKAATLNGSMEAVSAEQLVLAPVYSECKIKSGAEEFTAHVKAGKCTYALSSTEEVEEGHLFSGPLSIQCGAEEAIQVGITILGKEYECLRVSAQTPTGTVDETWAGSGSKRDLKLTSTLTGIKYTKKSLCGEGSFENGTYSGEATLSGENGKAESVGIWVGQLAFHLGSEDATLTGSSLNTQTFKLDAKREVTCKKASFSGTVSGKATQEIALVPAYSECKFKGPEEELTAHVHAGTCRYDLVASEETEAGTLFHGSAEVACTEAGDAIEVGVTLAGKEYACLSIAPQVRWLGLDYTQKGVGNGADLQLAAALTGIDYKLEGLCGEGSGEGATYSGEATLSGENGKAEAVPLWLGKSGRFTGGASETVLEAAAKGTQTFSSEQITLTCGEVGFAGMTETANESLVAEPSYSSCTVSGLPALVEMNGCTYVFSARAVGIEADGEGRISCPEGKSIQITAFVLGAYRKCMDIAAQTPTTPAVNYLNGTREGADDISLSWAIEGFQYTRTPPCGEGTLDNMKLSGEVTIWGKNGAGEPVDLFWDEPA